MWHVHWTEQANLTKDGFATSIIFTPCHLAHMAYDIGNLELPCSGSKSIRHWHPFGLLHLLLRKETSLTLISGNGTWYLLSSWCLWGWGSVFHMVMLHGRLSGAVQVDIWSRQVSVVFKPHSSNSSFYAQILGPISGFVGHIFYYLK